MKIFKSRDVKTPKRGTDKSAGIDFYIPNDWLPKRPGETDPTHFISPGDSVKIPSGIFAKVPEGKALIFFNRSGVATKKGLDLGACVVDEDYQGEIIIHLNNVSDRVVGIQNGEKIAQGILLDMDYQDVEEAKSKNELYPDTSERGEGGFGSTDEEDASDENS